jgi:tRNA modification GTPase
MRAFLASKLDLTRAEAVLAVIEAGSRDELRQALAQLAGGITRPLQELRSDLLDLLADLEAGLDFAEEDITFVRQEEMLRRITKALALVTHVRQQLDRRSVGERPFRAVLAGPPNAGKSSLFNKSAALVSPAPGTTRDYLLQRLELDGVAVEVVDTAGWQEASGMIEGQAQGLAAEQVERADLILFCAEAAGSVHAAPAAFAGRDVVHVATKCDLASAPADHLATSATTGLGIDGLRGMLRQRAQQRSRPALAPSLARCRGHVGHCLEHLRRAHSLVLEEEMPELVALELRGALDQLGEMAGAVYTDDLLDRIFSRFCIGK